VVNESARAVGHQVLRKLSTPNGRFSLDLPALPENFGQLGKHIASHL
jgi:hypothetical protein